MTEHCKQTAQRGCGLSLSGGIHHSTGQVPVQPDLGKPALADGLHQIIRTSPSKPYHSVTLFLLSIPLYVTVTACSYTRLFQSTRAEALLMTDVNQTLPNTYKLHRDSTL